MLEKSQVPTFAVFPILDTSGNPFLDDNPSAVDNPGSRTKEDLNKIKNDLNCRQKVAANEAQSSSKGGRKKQRLQPAPTHCYDCPLNAIINSLIFAALVFL